MESLLGGETLSFSCIVMFFFIKQKTAYEMRISDWSSDVCSSDLQAPVRLPHSLSEVTGPLWDCGMLRPSDDDLTRQHQGEPLGERIVVSGRVLDEEIARASCRQRVCQYV